MAKFKVQIKVDSSEPELAKALCGLVSRFVENQFDLLDESPGHELSGLADELELDPEHVSDAARSLLQGLAGAFVKES